MREEKRIDRILEKISRIWKENPDWRLGQLLVNCGLKESMPFFHEDDRLEAGLDYTIEQMEAFREKK